MPKRIQRLRTKGWRMPPKTIYVGRPTVFGNPYWHAAKFYGVALSLALFRNTANGCWNPQVVAGIPLTYYDDHCDWLKRIVGHPADFIRSELRGKDLACWCRLDEACHADILLEIANS